MRVLHVTHNYPRWPGDVSGVFLQSLAREQAAQGLHVAVLAPHAPGTAERERDGDVEVIRYRYGSDAREVIAYTGEMHELVRRSWGGRWRFLVMLLCLRRATRAAMRDRRADVVHVHWLFPGALALWPIGRVAGPSVLTVHGTDVFLLRRMPAVRPIARLVVRSARRVAAVSRALAGELAGIGATDVRVIPMPLDWSLHGPARDPSASPQDESHVLFVGRLSRQKGADDLLRAIAVLAPDLPALHLTVAGDGAERAALESLAATLGIADRVRFLGQLPPTALAPLYRTAAVLAIPSATGARGEQEGFGLVAVEGMLGGAAVVATATGGLVDIIEHEDSGLLVAERDPRALAAAIGRLVRDPAHAREMGARGRASAMERFAPASLARAYAELYLEAAGGGGGRGRVGAGPDPAPTPAP